MQIAMHKLSSPTKVFLQRGRRRLVGHSAIVSLHFEIGQAMVQRNPFSNHICEWASERTRWFKIVLQCRHSHAAAGDAEWEDIARGQMWRRTITFCDAIAFLVVNLIWLVMEHHIDTKTLAVDIERSMAAEKTFVRLCAPHRCYYKLSFHSLSPRPVTKSNRNQFVSGNDDDSKTKRIWLFMINQHPACYAITP